MDGEILISLKEKHTPTATAHRQAAPRAAEALRPTCRFFFQPADIVDQVLNFGQPAPIDIRVSGPNTDEAYALASAAVARHSGACPASSIRTSSRSPTRPR